MFGFSFYINSSKKDLSFDAFAFKESLHYENVFAFNHMIDKFSDDKVFFQDDDFIIILDGVVLNKKSFMKENGGSWADVIKTLFLIKGDCFFSEFRGSFSGIVYMKKKKRAIIFSDHIGTKFMYYYNQNGCLCVSSFIANIYDTLKENHISYSLSVENAYLLLSYGYMLDNRTLCSEINKITPGCYLVYENETLSEKQYFLLDNTPDYSISENDAIEMMDEKFRNAIKLQFGKDVEYGYKHFVGLSAGLDSRMVTWVSHAMGYTEQLNFTFSQTNYWDEIIPKQIASDLKHEWLFKALNNGLWLYDVDDVVRQNGGNVLYYGSAHGNSLLKYLNFNNLGILHNGQQGDIAFDTYYTGTDLEKQFCLGEGAFSQKYLGKINGIHLKQYKNEEIAHYYCRSFSGANNGGVIQMNYTELKSPFADIDVLSSILKVPLKYRMNRNLYFKWIKTKYPGAAKYVWDHLGYPIDRKIGIIHIGKKYYAIEKLPKLLIDRFTTANKSSSKNMNPIGYYLSTNLDLYNYIKNYCRERIELVNDSELRKDVTDIINGNNPLEIIQAVTLLSSLSLFFK